MRRKRDRRPAVPVKYRRYVPDEWPEGGWGQWVRERETWNAAQPQALFAGDGPAGPWQCQRL
jgi:hypothetical protein